MKCLLVMTHKAHMHFLLEDNEGKRYLLEERGRLARIVETESDIRERYTMRGWLVCTAPKE